MKATVPVVLCVGGLDPSGGAGLAADLRAAAAWGVLGAPIASALTVQGPRGVDRVEAVSGDLLAEQIRGALRVHDVRAVKIGLLPCAAAVRHAAEALGEFGGPVVVDPVFEASSGGRLAAEGTERALCEWVRGVRAAVLTPNVGEAQALLHACGSRAAAPSRAGAASKDEAARLAAAVAKSLDTTVVLTGGHLTAEGTRDVVDTVCEAGATQCVRVRHRRAVGGPVRGTGCAFATALAAGLARGAPLLDAVRLAGQFVANGMQGAAAIGASRYVVSWPNVGPHPSAEGGEEPPQRPRGQPDNRPATTRRGTTRRVQP